eukprot:TRINITY_DN28425_c0_g1_i1.p1 TRINITY_DN28425_c0_g1~~TRINITY_DN28425_c0_g1_i1.p1  ORF type:complete len:318 (+),score=59.58 TRINITY_DN28425_c0_g1_i1:88-1041(+)
MDSKSPPLMCVENPQEADDSWEDKSLGQLIEGSAQWLARYGIEPHFERGNRLISQWKQRSGEESKSPLKIGLCTAVKNRFHQLQRALPVNLLHAWPHQEWVTIHIVDFGSTDDTRRFLKEACKKAVEMGLLKIYLAKDLEYWHASIAKNTAHLVASEDILVNWDVDNILTPDFLTNLRDEFMAGNTLVTCEGGSGTTGRIAYRRSDFAAIRGYDEDAYPMGAQDIDIVNRLQKHGCRLKKAKWNCQAIPNSIEAKILNVEPRFRVMSWHEMDQRNRAIFDLRLKRGQILRNHHVQLPGVAAYTLIIPGVNDKEEESC